MSHKVMCSNHAASDRRLESPEQKAWSKKIKQCMSTWTPAISYCLPLALDLANHEWGRHDTHAYVLYALSFKFVFSYSIPTRSLVLIMEDTGLKEDHQSHRVGNFHTTQHVCVKPDLSYYPILV